MYQFILAKIEFDFIVVGSGSGGSVVGSRLTEAKSYTTLILEAGCADPALPSEVKKIKDKLFSKSK